MERILAKLVEKMWAVKKGAVGGSSIVGVRGAIVAIERVIRGRGGFGGLTALPPSPFFPSPYREHASEGDMITIRLKCKKRFAKAAGRTWSSAIKREIRLSYDPRASLAKAKKRLAK